MPVFPGGQRCANTDSVSPCVTDSAHSGLGCRSAMSAPKGCACAIRFSVSKTHANPQIIDSSDLLVDGSAKICCALQCGGKTLCALLA